MFTVVPFSRKSIVMGPFMSQKTVSMMFFTGCYAPGTFSLRVCLFNFGLILAKPVFTPSVNIFSLLHTHFVNFSWFAKN